MCHGVRYVAALFSCGLVAGLHRAAKDVLADPVADAAGLLGPHARDQSLAAAEEMDLILILIMKARRMLQGCNPWRTHSCVPCRDSSRHLQLSKHHRDKRRDESRRGTHECVRHGGMQWIVFVLLFLFVGVSGWGQEQSQAPQPP